MEDSQSVICPEILLENYSKTIDKEIYYDKINTLKI